MAIAFQLLSVDCFHDFLWLLFYICQLISTWRSIRCVSQGFYAQFTCLVLCLENSSHVSVPGSHTLSSHLVSTKCWVLLRFPFSWCGLKPYCNWNCIRLFLYQVLSGVTVLHCLIYWVLLTFISCFSFFVSFRCHKNLSLLLPLGCI